MYATHLSAIEELVDIALQRHTGQHNQDVVHRIAVRALVHPAALSIKRAVNHVRHWVCIQPAQVLRWYDCRFGPFITDEIRPYAVFMFGKKWKLIRPKLCGHGNLPFKFSRSDCRYAHTIFRMCSKCKLAVCAHCYGSEGRAMEMHDDICSLPL